MKKKILGILVVTLLIATAFASAANITHFSMENQISTNNSELVGMEETTEIYETYDTELYCEDFEDPCEVFDRWEINDTTGDMDTWTLSDKRCHSPAHSMHNTAHDTYLPNAEDCLIFHNGTNGLDVSGFDELKVCYWHRMQGEKAGVIVVDGGYVEYSFDNFNWVTATDKFSDNDWEEKCFTIDTEGKNALFIRFVFYSDEASCNEGWYLDDFCVYEVTAGEDKIPPTSNITIGWPKCCDGYYVNSKTPFTLAAKDNLGGSGVDAIYYRIWNKGIWSNWLTYTDSFYLLQGEYLHHIQYYAVDNAGNEESVHEIACSCDNEPPVTDVVIEDPKTYIGDHCAIDPTTPLEIKASDDCCRIKKITIHNKCFLVGTVITVQVIGDEGKSNPHVIKDASTYDFVPEDGSEFFGRKIDYKISVELGDYFFVFSETDLCENIRKWLETEGSKPPGERKPYKIDKWCLSMEWAEIDDCGKSPFSDETCKVKMVRIFNERFFAATIVSVQVIGDEGKSNPHVIKDASTYDFVPEDGSQYFGNLIKYKIKEEMLGIDDDFFVEFTITDLCPNIKKWLETEGSKPPGERKPYRIHEPVNMTWAEVEENLPCTLCQTNCDDQRCSGSGVDYLMMRHWYNGKWDSWVKYDGNSTGFFSLAEEGDHILEYYAVDKLGSKSSVMSTSVFVDGTQPPETILLLPEDGDTVFGAPFFGWSDVEDSSNVTYTLQIATDSGFNDVVLEKTGIYRSDYKVKGYEGLSPGKYFWRVKVADGLDHSSKWSETQSFMVKASNAPDKPSSPSGSKKVKIGEISDYSSSTIDPDGDQLWYCFDWGDGTDSGWVGPFVSGVEVSASHWWREKGTYEVKVRAVDEHGSFSEWSDPLSVSMPKNKPYINTPFLNFLQNHPMLFQLLQRFLKL